MWSGSSLQHELQLRHGNLDASTFLTSAWAGAATALTRAVGVLGCARVMRGVC
jgi:hypothetical protein